MAPRMISILLLALLSPAAGRQPATATGAVEAREKLVPKTTPMAMVIKLLKDLTVKVEAQGKEEAAGYDKYACFCKEQADEKLYAMETSDKKIKELNAKITELVGELASLSQDISDLASEISDTESKISALDQNRASENEKYEADNAELVAAIDACERAAEAMKESKAAMEGKAETGAALQQVHAAVTSASQKGFVVLTAEQTAALNELSRGRGPTDGQAYESHFHSNEIFTLLDDLRTDFINEKKDLDTTEFQNKDMYDNLRMQAENKKKFAGLDKAEKERVEAEKSAEKEQAVEDEYVEARAKKADDEFMGVLTAECKSKAELWDQRSKTNAEELKALADATEALESGAAPNFKANKKLVDLQTHKAPSFLQLRGGHGKKQENKREKVMALLSSASERLHSSVLAMVSLRVQASDDPFVKVRGLMKDLIARLEADAGTEADQKAFCDKEIKEAVTERDDAQAESETHLKDKTTNEAKSSQLNMDIATLSKQIADNKKAQMEATQLRTEESEENTKTVGEAEAGLEAVKQAISILEGFYNNAFVQTGTTFPPTREDELRFKSTNSDRSGSTVADLAPDVFDDTYHGQQESSKGILGTLEVIKTDFERTIQSTDDAEIAAEGEFQTLTGENEADTNAKDLEKGQKSDTLTITNEAILTLSSSLSDSTKVHELSENSLEALRASCVEKEETYEERVAKRNQEIEALKEAHAILEDWESQ